MKTKIFVLILCCLIAYLLSAWAQDRIEIAGIEVPLFSGAHLVQSASARPAQARVVTYSVSRPKDEVSDFYLTYLNENNFLVIGGKEEGGLNISVKKDLALFTLKVYAERDATIIQFIW
jgi:hypothetical protein